LGRKPRNSTNAQVVSPVNQTFTPTTPSVPAPRTTPAGSTPPAALPNPLQKTHPQGGWYVVVATYTRKIDAEKRARSLTARWPKFRARVFEPPVNDPHHLVIIGANLSQDDADALCKHARAAGLPHDVYIKKFLKSRSGETPTDIER
jgi:cell division septation protein DedD